MSHLPSDASDSVRAEWRERLRAARDRALEQVDELPISDLRALRETIAEEMESVKQHLPDPAPLQARGPVAPEEQTRQVKYALQYNALKVRHQVVEHELRRRALGPAAVEEEVDVPSQTRSFAVLAWEAMAENGIDTTMDVYREVARQSDEDVHVSTVEKWLRQENPHHPEETERSWAELRRAVLLAAA